eukprot:55713-Karenia_brevis.AAC.1
MDFECPAVVDVKPHHGMSHTDVRVMNMLSFDVVLTARSMLKSGKANGCDGLPTTVIKALDLSVVCLMWNAFAHILAGYPYPETWLKPYAAMVPKNDAPSDFGQFRAVTLDVCLFK